MRAQHNPWPGFALGGLDPHSWNHLAVQFFHYTSTLEPNRSYLNSQLFSIQIVIDTEDNTQ